MPSALRSIRTEVPLLLRCYSKEHKRRIRLHAGPSSQYQHDDKYHQEYKEQDLGNTHRGPGDAAETENDRNDRYHEDYNSPVKHRKPPFFNMNEINKNK